MGYLYQTFSSPVLALFFPVVVAVIDRLRAYFPFATLLAQNSWGHGCDLAIRTLASYAKDLDSIPSTAR